MSALTSQHSISSRDVTSPETLPDPAPPEDSFRDKLAESFDQCGKSVFRLCMPVLKGIYGCVESVYRAISIAISLIWLLVQPWILALLPTLMCIILVGLTISYLHTSFLPGVGAIGAKFGCTYGLQYFSGIASFFGLADICRQGSLPAAPDFRQRGPPPDTISGFDWQSVNKDLQKAYNVFDNMSSDVRRLLKNSSEPMLNQPIVLGNEVYAAAAALSETWQNASTDLSRLHDDHENAMRQIHMDVLDRAVIIKVTYQDLQHGGPSSWLAWLPGPFSPMGRFKNSIVLLARPDRQENLRELIRQVKDFIDAIRHMEKARTLMSRRFRAEMKSWDELCATEESSGTWFSKSKKLVNRKDATEPPCRVLRGELEKVLLQDRSESFDALNTFADASLRAYRALLRQYNGIERAVEDAKFTALHNTATNYRGYMFILERIHNQTVAATRALEEAMKIGQEFDMKRMNS